MWIRKKKIPGYCANCVGAILMLFDEIWRLRGAIIIKREDFAGHSATNNGTQIFVC